jgi:hypothetical protein
VSVLDRYLSGCAVLCLLCAFAAAPPAGGQHAAALYGFASIPFAPWIALIAIAGLFVLSRRALPANGAGSYRLGAIGRAALVACAALAFVVLRDASRSGDFQRVVYDLRAGVWLLKAEPLGPATLQLLQRAARLLGLASPIGIQWLLALASALGLLLLWRLAERMPDPSPRLQWLRFLALASTGTSALFFGHLELYTLPVIAMAGYLVAAQRTIASGEGFPLACALFTLACALHMQMLCLAPSLLLCAAAAARGSGVRRPFAVLIFGAALPLLALQWLCLRFPPPYPQFYGGADQRMLVAPTAALALGYWSDVLNRFLLFAPGAVAALVWTRLRPFAREEAFTLALVGAWVAFALFWNADLGGFRDWDLFAPIGLPLALAAVRCAAVRLTGPQQAIALCAFVIVNAMRTIPFVLDNAGVGAGGFGE